MPTLYEDDTCIKVKGRKPYTFVCCSQACCNHGLKSPASPTETFFVSSALNLMKGKSQSDYKTVQFQEYAIKGVLFYILVSISIRSSQTSLWGKIPLDRPHNNEARGANRCSHKRTWTSFCSDRSFTFDNARRFHAPYEDSRAETSSLRLYS